MLSEKKPRDTLEQIVEEAIERERLINEQHPERHGYGMIEGEANDLIHRIEHLEWNQLRAQQVKVKNRKDRIRVIGKDMAYSRSPEDIVVEKIDREEIRNAELNALKRMSKEDREIYDLREKGLLQREIAELKNVHRSTITKKLGNINEELKKEFEQIKERGENHLLE